MTTWFHYDKKKNLVFWSCIAAEATILGVFTHTNPSLTRFSTQSIEIITLLFSRISSISYGACKRDEVLLFLFHASRHHWCEDSNIWMLMHDFPVCRWSLALHLPKSDECTESIVRREERRERENKNSYIKSIQTEYIIGEAQERKRAHAHP